MDIFNIITINVIIILKLLTIIQKILEVRNDIVPKLSKLFPIKLANTLSH